MRAWWVYAPSVALHRPNSRSGAAVWQGSAPPTAHEHVVPLHVLAAPHAAPLANGVCVQPSVAVQLSAVQGLASSQVIGTWAHQFLDSVTHKDGWLVTHSFLDAPLFMYVHQTFRICHCLWYALSFAGIVWVGLVYQRWAAGTAASSKPASDGGPLVNAVLLATSLMLVSACFRVVFHWSGVFLEGALNLFIVVVFLVRTQPDSK